MEMKKYSFRLLNVGESYTKEERQHLEKKEAQRKAKNLKTLERIRKTERNGKVFVDGLGRVKAF